MTTAPVTPFYLRSLVATATGSTAPTTQFTAGTTFTLSWDSNGTSFTVYAANDANPVYTGTATSCAVTGGRTSDTTFVVVASVTGGTESGAPYPGFTTVTLYDALTVTISDPTLTPASVTAGTLTVTGTTALQDVTAASATVAGALTANGAATLSGGAAVGGNLAVSGTTTLNGSTTMGNATVGGNLTAGSASLGGASAASLTVSSWVQMLNPKSIAAGSYSAGSDGLVLGTVGPSNNSGQKCSAIAIGWSSATGNLYATGGNHVYWTDGDNFWSWTAAGSFCLPISRGAAFQLYSWQVDGNEQQAPVSFGWVPFGTQAALTELGEDEAAAAGIPAVERPEHVLPSSPPWMEPDHAIDEVISVLHEIVGRFPEEDAERMASALRSLATHKPQTPLLR